MPTVPHTIRIRRRRTAKQGARLLAIAGLGASTLLSLVLALGAAGLALGYAGVVAGLPAPDAIPALLEPPDGLLLEPTRLYGRTGEQVILTLENPAAKGRRYLRLGEETSGARSETGPSQGGTGSSREGGASGEETLAPVLAEVMVATFDPEFWEHPGFSLEGLVEGSRTTLAERLAGELLLWAEPPGLRRSLRERILAAQITARFGRDRVLEWYLNSADFGRFAYGADAAARAYLGKPATRLSLAEAALLTAAAEAPALNPADAPAAALERKDEILARLSERGLIRAEDLARAREEKLALRRAASSTAQTTIHIAPAFTDLALGEASTRIDFARLARGGLRVVTTLDYELQIQAACAAAAQVARLEGVPAAEIAPGVPCQAARLLPTLSTPAGQARPGTAGLAAGLVALDPLTGQVLAMVGDNRPGLNPAQAPGRPPGTLLTPFIYLAAFSRGWSPASLVWDIPASLPESLAGVENPDGEYHGPVRLRVALANDYLAPAAKLLDEIGAEGVWSSARQLGLASLEDLGREEAGSLPFRGGEITLLEATQAYGVFASGGLLAGQPGGSNGSEAQAVGAQARGGVPDLRPVTVLQIAETGGNLWLDCPGQGTDCPLERRPVISAPLAYLVTHTLSDEPARWPSLGHPNPLEIGRPAGVKIGRTREGRDAWTVGYTPSLVLGVWLGEQESADSENGTRPEESDRRYPAGAAGLWHAIMQFATRDQPAAGWKAPPGVSTLQVCDPSGLLPSAHCPAVVNEVFLDGSEPTQEDTLFRTLGVNRETGQLATIFTPPELVEDRVYMRVPPEADAWARAAGLPVPPQDYDLIRAPEAHGQAWIEAPAMFASVSGQVPVLGRASGSDFEFYRLQAGQGLNPPAWIQIGEDVSGRVADGTLGTWDTSGLEGLFTLQLLVVGEAGEVETATVQVTVDNQAPDISVVFPAPGQRFTYPQDESLVFEVEADDELALAEVEFFLDGDPLASRAAPPFTVPWEARLGDHRLQVQATDRAGNASQAEVRFRVER
jgi:membrane peptidoglycan carboxypeptidase